MDADERAAQVAARMLGNEAYILGLGIAVDAARVGFSRLSMVLTAEMLNGHGTAHGGVLFTLADTAFAYACNSRNEAAVAQQASIVFLSPGQAGERLTATAVEDANQGRSGVYTVTVNGGDGRVVAVFQGLSRTIGRPVIGPEN